MQFYSDKLRETEEHALSDCEVFYVDAKDFLEKDTIWKTLLDDCKEKPEVLQGFYFWFCFPGCSPDSMPMGPFKTEEEAITDCQNDYTDWEEYKENQKQEQREKKRFDSWKVYFPLIQAFRRKEYFSSDLRLICE